MVKPTELIVLRNTPKGLTKHFHHCAGPAFIQPFPQFDPVSSSPGELRGGYFEDRLIVSDGLKIPNT